MCLPKFHLSAMPDLTDTTGLSFKTEPRPDSFTTQYVVHAYRYGTLDMHNYLVGSFLDLAVATDVAKEECECRGGKYGVAVYETFGIRKPKQVAYFPSCCGESCAEENDRVINDTK